MFHGNSTTSSASAPTIPVTMAKDRQGRFEARAPLLGISLVHVAMPKSLVALLGARCQHNALALSEIVLFGPVWSVCADASSQRQHDRLAVRWPQRQPLEPALHVGQGGALDGQRQPAPDAATHRDVAHGEGTARNIVVR